MAQNLTLHFTIFVLFTSHFPLGRALLRTRSKMPISVILIPTQGDLETLFVCWDESSNSFQGDVQRILQQQDYLETPLLRPRHKVAGLYAYHNTLPAVSAQGHENVRATRLAMACGCFSARFFGPVLLVRSFGGKWDDLMTSEIYGATSISPDLNAHIQQKIAQEIMGMTDYLESTTRIVPDWLANAAQQNYHDGGELAKVMSAMNRAERYEEESNSSSDDNSNDNDNDDYDHEITPATTKTTTKLQFLANSPLCLHCRRLSSEPCPSCRGAYFCKPEANTGRDCRMDGWPHQCWCTTWKIYVSRRRSLSDFNGFFGEWQPLLTDRPHQLGHEPYQIFLHSLGINIEDCRTWWRTEMGGWSGGQSSSASGVDASIRLAYQEGFAPITEIPSECHVSPQDLIDAGLESKRNAVGLIKLSSWEDYYKLRRIPPSSPISLLCTFPLTIYHAIERYGEVPVTVARMLKRPLRVHIVGAEKEINFLDLFQELKFLFPADLSLELVFIVREDMLPNNCRTSSISADRQFSMRIDFDSLVIGIVTGTYGGASLNPNFDCGTGPPDMVIGLNAGLFAYESWRSVVKYLYEHRGVVGVFSDYNEYSGTNCASLGGASSRQSLCVNPFRQPRCMPVYSMNLPQFSNGFLYTFNEQELD